jgi:hypothetical protein
MIGKALKALLIVLAVLSTPVYLGSYLWGMRLLFDQMPAWLWLAMMACNATAVLGICLLIDVRRERAGLPPL